MMGQSQPGRPESGVTAGEVVSARLREHTDEFLTRVPHDTTGPTVDDVHQARVALRRLRSDFRLFALLLDAEKVRPLRDEISWFAGELGVLRDLDVMAEVMESLSGAAGVDPTPVVVELARRRTEAELGLARTLVGQRSKGLRCDLLAFASDPPLLGRADRSADAVLSKEVRRAWRRLERAVDATGPDASPAALHQVRIRAKRARYASETLARAGADRPPKPARRLAALQDHLGSYHDRVVAAAWLREFGPDAGSPATAFIAGALAVEAEHDADRLATTWRPRWKRAHAARPRWHD